jgi:hippurate hydrolase
VRRDIHAHPELCFEEVHRRCGGAKLTEWGIPIHRGLGKTGVVGIVKAATAAPAPRHRPARRHGRPAHAGVQHLRPRQQPPGKMHACGHDGHTHAAGAAQHLAKHRNFDGTVYLIFQPAEEGGGGARDDQDGLFEKFPMEAVFGMHNWPGMAVGQFAVSPAR